MAKGAPTPASFKKGDPRASLAGKKSSRALPQELKDARKENANKIEQTLYKFMSCTEQQLIEALKNPSTPSIELIVIKIITEAIKTGDHQRLNFLLDRTIGRVVDKVEIDAQITTKSLHSQIIDIIEADNGN
jgi:hypothetical protein